MNHSLATFALAVSCVARASTDISLNNPDTGINAQQCYSSGSDVLGSCAAADLPGQDGQMGRDANASTRDGSDGKLGFTFTRICNSGQDAGQGTCPADPVLGDGADDWACTRENLSGRILEVKTASGMRAGTALYTYYVKQYDPWGLMNSPNNVTTYLAAVNAMGLCGGTDWIIDHATRHQAYVNYGIAAAGAPLIDANYFPNTQAGPYWSSSPHTSDWKYEWTYGLGDGDISDADSRDTPHYVRLARARTVKGVNPRFVPLADPSEVMDNLENARLIWRACVEGTTYSNGECVGTPATFTHEQALVHAARVAKSTGEAWRVPNVKELTWIVERSVIDPSIVGPFPDTPPAVHWTSTPVVRQSSDARTVEFSHGVAAEAPRTSRNVLRLVRSVVQ